MGTGMTRSVPRWPARFHRAGVLVPFVSRGGAEGNSEWLRCAGALLAWRWHAEPRRRGDIARRRAGAGDVEYGRVHRVFGDIGCGDSARLDDDTQRPPHSVTFFPKPTVPKQEKT